MKKIFSIILIFLFIIPLFVIFGSVADASAPVTDVIIDQTSVTLQPGKSVQLNATILPPEASDKRISWSTDSNVVARVDDGVVSAGMQGTAVITATAADGGKTASCIVTVTDTTTTTTIPTMAETTSGAVTTTTSTTATIATTTDPNGFTDQTNKQAAHPVSDRVCGDSRTGTAIEISKKGWSKSENVVLAYSGDFPDALAGGPLAFMLDAPILLTRGGSRLEDDVLTRIAELGAKNIYILGGESVISAAIENQLMDKYTALRVFGENRYKTSVAIAERMDEIRGCAPNTVFIADSMGFADALSATPVAAMMKAPIIFTPRTSASINAASLNYIKSAKSRGTEDAVIVGGTSAVKLGVEDELMYMGLNVDRIFGQNRYETSAEIYTEYKNLFLKKETLMATGGDFPDALSGGVLGSKMKSPLFLVDGTGRSLSVPIKSAVADMSPEKVLVLGGQAAVCDSAVKNHI